MLFFDSIYDSEVSIGGVIEARRQYGLVLVAFVPCDSRRAIGKLNDTVDVGLFSGELIFVAMNSWELY